MLLNGNNNLIKRHKVVKLYISKVRIQLKADIKSKKKEQLMKIKKKVSTRAKVILRETYALSIIDTYHKLNSFK